MKFIPYLLTNVKFIPYLLTNVYAQSWPGFSASLIPISVASVPTVNSQQLGPLQHGPAGHPLAVSAGQKFFLPLSNLTFAKAVNTSLNCACPLFCVDLNVAVTVLPAGANF